MPNKTWFINLSLIINECCVTSMFVTALLFAYLDKISKLLKLTLKLYQDSEDLELRRKIGILFVYCSFIMIYCSAGAMGLSFIRMAANGARFLY